MVSQVESLVNIRLMEEILHHLGCKRTCKEWDKLPIEWLTGFLPSTVGIVWHCNAAHGARRILEVALTSVMCHPPRMRLDSEDPRWPENQIIILMVTVGRGAQPPKYWVLRTGSSLMIKSTRWWFETDFIFILGKWYTLTTLSIL